MAKGYLYIKVDSESGEQFASLLDSKLSPDWKRAVDWEQRTRAQSLDKESEFYFYERIGQGRGHRVGLTIHRMDAETLYVSNIIPLDRSELTDAEYNEAQREFEKLVQGAAFPAYITGETPKLVLGPKSEEALQKFCAFANPSTGSAHPLDLKRWVAFLVSAHRERCIPDPTAFSQWLSEVQGWTEGVSNSLASELEFARSLLDWEAENPN